MPEESCSRVLLQRTSSRVRRTPNSAGFQTPEYKSGDSILSRNQTVCHREDHRNNHQNSRNHNGLAFGPTKLQCSIVLVVFVKWWQACQSRTGFKLSMWWMGSRKSTLLLLILTEMMVVLKSAVLRYR